MYRSFYYLKTKPFELHADPSFFWLGESYKDAMSLLRYGITENKGFLLLTGEEGCGKTSLVNNLLQQFDSNLLSTTISRPSRDRLNFYTTIAKGFGFAKEVTSKVQFLIQFSNFLHETYAQRRDILLIIDDCHTLSQEMLEELRLLSNVESGSSKLITILFVGRKEFETLLVEPQNRAVRQRISLKVDIRALTLSETQSYLEHRLKIAGTEANLFSKKALQGIFGYTLGNPKQINILCEKALTCGHSLRCRTIDRKIIDACLNNAGNIKELQDNSKTSLKNQTPGRHQDGRQKKGAIKTPFSNIKKKALWGASGVTIIVVFITLSFYWHQSEQKPELVNKSNKSFVLKNGELIKKTQENSQIIISPKPVVIESNTVETKDIGKRQQIVLEQEQKNINQEISNNPAETKPEKINESVAKSDMEQPNVGNSFMVQKGEGFVSAQHFDATRDDQKGQISQRIEQTERPELPVVPDDIAKNSITHRLSLALEANSLALTPEAKKTLENFVETIKQFSKGRLLVKGYVSSKINSEENIKLSKDRAVEVQKLLVAKGVDSRRIEVIGMGNQEPIASNDTVSGRIKNRRVEIVVFSAQSD